MSLESVCVNSPCFYFLIADGTLRVGVIRWNFPAPHLLLWLHRISAIAGSSPSYDICVPLRSTYNSAITDTAYFVFLYVIPLGIITALNGQIAWHLRKSCRLLRMEPSNNSSIL